MVYVTVRLYVEFLCGLFVYRHFIHGKILLSLFTVDLCWFIELHEAARRRDLRSNDDDDDDTTSIYLHPLINYSFIHSFIQMKNSQNSQFIYAGSCGDNDKKSTIIHQRH